MRVRRGSARKCVGAAVLPQNGPGGMTGRATSAPKLTAQIYA